MEAPSRLRYHSVVFIAPPWPEIFEHDRERKQSWDEAEATWRAMVDVYEEFGYTLIHLPKTPIADRVRFVLNQVGTRRD